MASVEYGGNQPQGHGTHAGGGVVGPPAPHVCNQPLLVLDPTVTAALSHCDARALAMIHLEFARGVSELAASAYARVLSLLAAN